MNTDKQQILIDFCLKNGRITKQEADGLLNRYYYHNGSKYVSEILKRLVDSGKFIRPKTGLYVIGNGKKKTDPLPDMPTLF